MRSRTTPRHANLQGRANTQAAVLGHAAELIAARGYHGMSMRDLAAAAGMGLSSLYTYFPSKDALLATLQTRAFESLLTSAAAADERDGTPETHLYAFVYQHVRYVVAHRAVMGVLVHEAGSLPAAERARVRALKERYFAVCRRLVGALAGDAGGAALDRATYHLFGMLNWLWGWYDAERHGTAEDVARSVFALFADGVRPPVAAPRPTALSPGLGGSADVCLR